ncbi:IGP family C-type lectin domain [Trypanosoma melophagium]|uniref:IGP family C-type lectin domain n=1 Tax=Trypanosoma melophagium TaxID=715481 RepID=UPI00351A70F2|nr:IGP family C-type lectin domain [Trypanosoma melophagium]
MSGNAHVRTAAAVRTAVLWMSICMLLQQLGHHPQFTVEAEGSFTVNILRYFTVSNSVFAKNYGGRVDFSNSVDVCRSNGGSLVTGQSAAAQDATTTQLREAMPVGKTLAHTYMGGDAMYSINWQKDPTKVCKRGIAGASLKCIYEWNMGLFTSETTDGIGVAFYRGTLYTVPGAGPVNGYTPFWPAKYPAHGQPFMISRYVSGPGAVSTWYDGIGVARQNKDTPENTYLVVCEVQDGLDVNVTTLPPTPKPASWIQKHWYVPLIIILAALVAAALLIILLCCLVGRDDDKYLYPMVIRDSSDVPLRARDIDDDDDDDDDDGHYGNRDLPMPEPVPMPMENIDAANVSLYSVAENSIYDDGDVFADRSR